MPLTWFYHNNGGHPQEGAIQGEYYKNALNQCANVLRFKTCGLKNIFKYQTQINFCDKFECVTNVLCSYYIFIIANIEPNYIITRLNIGYTFDFIANKCVCVLYFNICVNPSILKFSTLYSYLCIGSKPFCSISL